MDGTRRPQVHAFSERGLRLYSGNDLPVPVDLA